MPTISNLPVMTDPCLMHHILGLLHHCCALLHHVWEHLHKGALVATALLFPLRHKCPVLWPIHLSVCRCVDSSVLKGKHLDTVMVTKMILVREIPVKLKDSLIFGGFPHIARARPLLHLLHGHAVPVTIVQARMAATSTPACQCWTNLWGTHADAAWASTKREVPELLADSLRIHFIARVHSLEAATLTDRSNWLWRHGTNWTVYFCRTPVGR